MGDGEPINFDFTPGPPKVEPEAAAEPGDVKSQAEAAVLPVDAIAPAETAGASSEQRLPAVPALPPIPDFRARDYPFAATSRFQRQAVETLGAQRASRGRRLAWGILAAVGAAVFVASTVIVLKFVDQATR